MPFSIRGLKLAQDERRNSILKAAIDAIHHDGLPFISNALIAKRSGVSRQLIRYYFKSKEELMIEICDMLAAAYRKALVDVALSNDSANRLEQLLDFYFDFLEGKTKPRDDQVYDAMMSLAAGSPAVKENLRGQYSLLGSVVSQEITVNYPNITVEDADQLSYLFVCLMYGHWKMVATLGLNETHRVITRKAIDRLISSYQQSPSKPEDQPKIWSV